MNVLNRFRLDGRRVFISGGSRGLGREMALALADVGADVRRGRCLASDASAFVTGASFVIDGGYTLW